MQRDVRTDLPPLSCAYDKQLKATLDEEEDPEAAVLRLYGVDTLDELPPGVFEQGLPSLPSRSSSRGFFATAMSRRASAEGASTALMESQSAVLAECVAGLQRIAGVSGEKVLDGATRTELARIAEQISHVQESLKKGEVRAALEPGAVKRRNSALRDGLDPSTRITHPAIDSPEQLTPLSENPIPTARAVKGGLPPVMPVRPLGAKSAFERALPGKAREVLEKRLVWEFDVFAFADAMAEGLHSSYRIPPMGGHAGQQIVGPLTAMGVVLCNDSNLLGIFGLAEERLVAFLSAIEGGYQSVPYHNAVHACDVLQTFNFFVTTGGMGTWMTDLEKLAALISCAVHDFQHPGVNNHFLVSTRAPLAQRYNDTHVLENHHLSASFSIMSRPECDLCEGMKREEAAQFRDLMVSLVLVTDMVVHFDFVADVQRRLEASDGCLDEKVRDRRVILRLALKCADISNPAKPVRGAVRWTAAVIGEFFHQGDRERELGLPVSPLCDRTTTNIPKSQVYFLELIVEPLFKCYGEVVPIVHSVCLPALRHTKAYWAALAARGVRSLEAIRPPKEDEMEEIAREVSKAVAAS